jgi:hypothetical protein
MEKDKLIHLFERKIDHLLENNEGYSRFRGMNPLKIINEILSREASKADIVDLGFLLHLCALRLRLTMYKNLTPFSMPNFKKDLQEIINTLHVYQKHGNHETKPPVEIPEFPGIKTLIPPLQDMSESKSLSSSNPELYNVILDVLGMDEGEIDMGIPESIIREMQHIDLKKIYNELPSLIEKEGCSTVRKLTWDFPVFENDRLSLVAVFSEVLFLANEGKVSLMQMDDDIRVRILL